MPFHVIAVANLAPGQVIADRNPAHDDRREDRRVIRRAPYCCYYRMCNKGLRTEHICLGYIDTAAQIEQAIVSPQVSGANLESSADLVGQNFHRCTGARRTSARSQSDI